MSQFIKVRCPKCKNEQIVFSKPASEVACVICNNALVHPTGSKGVVKGSVVETYN